MRRLRRLAHFSGAAMNGPATWFRRVERTNGPFASFAGQEGLFPCRMVSLPVIE